MMRTRVDADAGAEAVIAGDGEAHLMQEIDQRVQAGDQRAHEPTPATAQTKIWVGSLERSRLCMRKKRRVCPQTAALARSDMPRAGSCAQKSSNSPSFPRHPDHRPLHPYPSPIFWAILRRVPTREIFHGSGRNPAGPAARLGHGGGATARPLARLARLPRPVRSIRRRPSSSFRPTSPGSPTPTIRRAARIRARSRAHPPIRASTIRWCAGGRAI